MDTAQYKQALLDKERDLVAEIARLTAGGKDDPEEVRDYADSAASDQSASGSLDTATALNQTLEEVGDALQRIDDGSYGTCAVCEEPIEPARLQAVPWAQYCLKDQEAMEAGKGASQGATL